MLKRLLNKFSTKIIKFPDAYKLQKLKKRGLLSIGRGTYGTPIIDTYKGSETKVKIGNYTSIGPSVRIITGGMHPIRTVSQYPFRSMLGLPGAYCDGNPYSKGEIIIGSDVWIGTGVTILSGVKIGDGAIIGANSIVTKDIPDYAVAFGAPATVLKLRFSKEEIEALKVISWWDWPVEDILDRVDNLTDDCIESFINKYRSK